MDVLPATESARLEALVRMHQRAVRTYLAWLGCPSAQLDDIVQDTFLSAFASGFEDRGEGPARVYLRSVAKHLLLRWLALRRREPSQRDVEELELELASFERDDGGEAALAALRACLEALEEKALAAVRLRYGEDLGERQIGSRLGLKEAGVGALLVRTRKRLRACVERRLRT